MWTAAILSSELWVNPNANIVFAGWHWCCGGQTTGCRYEVQLEREMSLMCSIFLNIKCPFLAPGPPRGGVPFSPFAPMTRFHAWMCEIVFFLRGNNGSSTAWLAAVILSSPEVKFLFFLYDYYSIYMTPWLYEHDCHHDISNWNFTVAYSLIRIQVIAFILRCHSSLKGPGPPS